MPNKEELQDEELDELDDSSADEIVEGEEAVEDDESEIVSDDESSTAEAAEEEEKPKKRGGKKGAKKAEKKADEESDEEAKSEVTAEDIEPASRSKDQKYGDLEVLARNKRFAKHVEGSKGKTMRAALANSPLVHITLPYDPSNLKEKFQEFQMNTVLFRLPLGKPVMVPLIVEEFIRQTMYRERPNHEMLLVSA
jgi:hypothetical protein